MRAHWNIWHDVDGCGETALALTPLKDKKHAETRKKEITKALKLMSIVKKWLKDTDVPAYGDWTFSNLTKFLEESKK